MRAAQKKRSYNPKIAVGAIIMAHFFAAQTMACRGSVAREKGFCDYRDRKVVSQVSVVVGLGCKGLHTAGKGKGKDVDDTTSALVPVAPTGKGRRFRRGKGIYSIQDIAQTMACRGSVAREKGFCDYRDRKVVSQVSVVVGLGCKGLHTAGKGKGKDVDDTTSVLLPVAPTGKGRRFRRGKGKFGGVVVTAVHKRVHPRNTLGVFTRAVTSAIQDCSSRRGQEFDTFGDATPEFVDVAQSSGKGSKGFFIGEEVDVTQEGTNPFTLKD